MIKLRSQSANLQCPDDSDCVILLFMIILFAWSGVFEYISAAKNNISSIFNFKKEIKTELRHAAHTHRGCFQSNDGRDLPLEQPFFLTK